MRQVILWIFLAALVGIVVWQVEHEKTNVPIKKIITMPEAPPVIPKKAPQIKTIPPVYEIDFRKLENLDRLSEKKFNGQTTIELVEDPQFGEQVLELMSRDTSSMFYEEINIPMEDHPILHWEWRALEWPTNKENVKLASKKDNDYAVRVYAMFKGLTIFDSEVIQYVWDDHFDVDTIESSPYSKNVKIVVVQKEYDDSTNGWAREVRDLYADYEKYFGRKPKKPLSAIAFMSDSDDTNTASRAQVKFLKIITKKSQKNN